jgi:trimethylamine--corrinoid protein Co-methyltransferase
MMWVIWNQDFPGLEAFMKETEINDDTLALDLIDEVGPGGQYLDHPHTLKYFRERWYPDLFERGNYNQWRGKGKKDLGQRANEKVDAILATHKPELLPEDMVKALGEIVTGE